MGSLPDLTVKERTLIHLYQSRVPDWEMELPEELTQMGIAEKVGVSRAHISQTLTSLEKEGMVKSKKSRIKRHKRRKKAYSLLEPGRKEAEKLYDFLLHHEVTLVIEGESEEYSFEKAVEKSELSILELYTKVKDERRFVITEASEKESIEEPAELEETEVEREAHEKEGSYIIPILSFIFLGTSAVLNIFNVIHMHEESLLCFYPVGFVMGLILISYFFYISEKRSKMIEQLFSFFIILNVFSAILFYDYIQNGVVISDLYSFLLVFVSVMAVTTVPFEPIKRFKGEIPYISSPLLISHGLFSYIYPDLQFTSSLPLFWIVTGFFLIDLGHRWFKDVEKKHSIFLGMGLYLIFIFMYWFMEGSTSIIHQVTMILWTGFGLFLVITRFLSSERRKNIYTGLLRGSVLSVSVFFVMLAWVLISLDKYIEAGMELILSGIFIFSLYSYKGDVKQIFYYGVALAVLVFMTFLSLFFF